VSESREDTGYTKDKREKKRVPIAEYGNKLKAEKAKEELKQLKEQLKPRATP
jgi:hypothetical protein